MKETDQRARKRPREYGVKDASLKKMGVSQVLHRRKIKKLERYRRHRGHVCLQQKSFRGMTSIIDGSNIT